MVFRLFMFVFKTDIFSLIGLYIELESAEMATKQMLLQKSLNFNKTDFAENIIDCIIKVLMANRCDLYHLFTWQGRAQIFPHLKFLHI